MTFLGKKNIYLCHSCGHGFVTMDVAEDTTPFMTNCLSSKCDKLAQSLFYRAPQDMLKNIKPALEWYLPTEAELNEMGASIATREHVKMFGLISRLAGEGS